MTWRSRGAALLREPLVHFLLAGAAIFAVFGNSSSPDERRIVIDSARIQRIAGEFEQSFRRLPSQEELDDLIREDVKNEVYYREGLRLGLDRDDIVVKRRLRSKMQGFETTAEDLPAPDDATLRKWIDDHPGRFAGQPQYSFDQRYLGSTSGGAGAALAMLNEGKDFAGAPAPLPGHFENADGLAVADLLGDDFVKALDRLPLGVWAGPVASGVGQHLVRLRSRNPATTPPLGEIRQRVENDWRSEKAREASDAAYRKMLARYDVVIEGAR